MSKSNVAAQKYVAYVQGLKDAAAQVEAVNQKWDSMSRELARGYTQRQSNADENVWLYLVVHRNVFKDHGFSKIKEYYLSLAGYTADMPAPAKKTMDSIVNYFNHRRQLGAEFFESETTGTRTPKTAIVKVTEYLAGVTSKLAGADKVATADEVAALCKAVNSALNAVSALASAVAERENGSVPAMSDIAGMMAADEPDDEPIAVNQ